MFERNNVMVEEEVNDYLEIKLVREAPVRAGLLTIETTEKILTQLDEEIASGPDMLPKLILKCVRKSMLRCCAHSC